MGLSGPAALLGTRFRIEIEGLDDAPACAVMLPQARGALSRGSLTRVAYSALVLRRALGERADWYAWWERSRQGGREPRRVMVSLLDGAGNIPLRWTFDGARPTGYAVSDLDAMESAPLFETLELAVRGFEMRFGPGAIAPAPARKRPAARRRTSAKS